MKAIFTLLFTLIISGILMAQNVGIGTATPDPSAKLDITANNKGLLIPQVSLNAVTNGLTPVSNPATGLLVWNTNATVTGGDGIGFYYWDGSIWKRLQSENAWLLNGNAGTDPASNFVGTTDVRPLIFRTSNAERMRIRAGGNVGINTSTPGSQLAVNGTVSVGVNYANAAAPANGLVVEGRTGVGVYNPDEKFHVNGNAKIGIDFEAGVQGAGWGDVLYFSGAPDVSSVYGNDNSDLMFIGRYNVVNDYSELRVNVGDNLAAASGWDRLNIGAGNKNNFQSIMYITARPLVGINTTAPTALLSVNGAANKLGGGTWAVFSDRRLKKNITPFIEGIDLLKKVNVVNFQYNDKMTALFGNPYSEKDKIYQGVIAQELQKIAPDMVSTKKVDVLDENGIVKGTESVLEVDPNKFIYALINATKEQQQRIEELEARLKILEQ